MPELAEVDPKGKNASGDPVTKFEAFQGSKELTFIVPKNFSNYAQKIIKSSHVVDDTLDENEEGGTTRGSRSKPLKGPEMLKKVCSMFKGRDHEKRPQEYALQLNRLIPYEDPDVKVCIRTEIQTKVYGDNVLTIRVFKILPQQVHEGDSEDSSNEA